MGFSFGGLLALRVLEHLQDRVAKVIPLSPVVSRRALKWSTPEIDLQGLHQGAEEFLLAQGYASCHEHASIGMAIDIMCSARSAT